MKASLRPALFVMGAVTLCGLAVLKSAGASAPTTLAAEITELGHKDGGAVEMVELAITAGKDAGAVELGHKDGGAVEMVELAVTAGKEASVVELSVTGGKDAGAIELMAAAEKGKDSGSITTEKSDAK